MEGGRKKNKGGRATDTRQKKGGVMGGGGTHECTSIHTHTHTDGYAS